MRKQILGIAGILVVLFIVVQVVKFSPFLFNLFFNKTIDLKKTNDRINVLLLGTGGGKHEGPNLTDSIIFANLDIKGKKVNLVSIPRDLWVPEISAKVNQAYAQGEEKKKGGGIMLAKAVVTSVVRQPIDYVVRIDFAGFVKAVDLVGGLDIAVDRSFDDYEYPIEEKMNDPCGHKEEELTVLATASSQLEAFPCRYTHIHFDKGDNHMEGKTALEFVRSRHALGPEGSDFARSKRQEKIVEALKNKVLSPQTLLNPFKVVSLYNAISENIDTDIPKDSFDDFVKLAKDLKGAKVYSVTIDFGDSQEERSGLLVNPPISKDYGGAWVLIPRIGNGNFSEIQSFIACEIQSGNCNITPSPTEKQ